MYVSIKNTTEENDTLIKDLNSYDYTLNDRIETTFGNYIITPKRI